MVTNRKNDITREQLIIVMARYIKDCAKELNCDRPKKELNIKLRNWRGCGKDGMWQSSEIRVNGTEYRFYDREITDADFIVMCETALKESKIKGKVRYKEFEETRSVGWSYRTIKHILFDGVVIVDKPCKEFEMMNRYFKKYAEGCVGDMDVYVANVCGKRNDYSVDMYSANYLAHDKSKCDKVIKFIREKRTSKDKLEFKVIEGKVEHDDEYEYRSAMDRESEWFGSIRNSLEVKVSTPTGREKGVLIV